MPRNQLLALLVRALEKFHEVQGLDEKLGRRRYGVGVMVADAMTLQWKNDNTKVSFVSSR
jgi:hypothetical protein